MDQKYYWYLFCGSSSYGFHNLTIGFDYKDKISEKDISSIKEEMNERARNHGAKDTIDVCITSINYLGHMSDEEFLDND